MSSDSFGARSTLEVNGRQYEVFRLDALQERFDVARLPYSVKVLLENVLRLEDGVSVSAADVEAIASWDAAAEPSVEIPFQPARVLMQDFTGVPAVVDLAAMRDAMEEIGGDPAAINPLVDVDLVIDHSVQVDAFGNERAFAVNAERDFERNRERYSFLKWGQHSFDNFRVVPPATGICHQVNLEYLAQVVYSRESGGVLQAYPDTLVGTDSHTTMVNGLGVLGWGVGGIEAEAAMLGQPISMLLPQVVGFRLSGELPEGATATDLVLTATEMLRERGVVSKFVEFFGPGLATLGLADRATLGNMSPEFGSTCAIFPVDAETLRYLDLTGRPTETIELVDAYARAQGMFHDESSEEPVFSDLLELDLGDGRPEHRRPETAAGPGAALRGQAVLPGGDGRVRPRGRRADGQRARRGDRGVLPRLRPAGRGPRRRARQAPSRRERRGSHRRAVQRRRDRRHAAGRHGVRARPRQGGDRRDHQLHQHLQPERDGRRRAARPQRRAARARAQAVGEDLAGARLDRGHRLPAARRPDRVPRRAPVQPGRLRLHHLHRQLRAAGAGDLRGDRREGPGGLRGPLRQPQLRGADQPGREGQLPRQPAAGRRLRAGRPDGRRPGERAAGGGLRRRAGLPARPGPTPRR